MFSKYRDQLIVVAKKLVSQGKSILYADESTIENLFKKIARREEIIPGIIVDKGTVTIPGSDGETATLGLDNLADLCKYGFKYGAGFAKWRAVLKIDIPKGFPSQLAINESAHTLARFAAISQENGLVPIIEPEILMDGSHSIEDSAAITESVLKAVFKALKEHHVMLEGALLNINMVLNGTANDPATPDRVGQMTVSTLQKIVPKTLTGVVFLSGFQTELEVNANLGAINKIPNSPWTLSISYGGALQASVVESWKGSNKNINSAQSAFIKRVTRISHALLGKYVNEDDNDFSY